MDESTLQFVDSQRMMYLWRIC